MSATSITTKTIAVSACALFAAVFILAAPSPAHAGKKTRNLLLGAAAGAAGLALLGALAKKNKRNPPAVAAAPPPRVYRGRPRARPTRSYYPRPRPIRPYAPRRSRATFSYQTQGIQQALNSAGFNVGLADGLMGRSTRAGVRQFQASIGQPATGYLSSAQHSMLLQRARGGAAPGYPAAGAPRAPGYNPYPGRPSTVGYPAAPAGPAYRPPAAPAYPANPAYRPPAAPAYPANPAYRPPAAPAYPAVPGYPRRY